MYQAVPEDAADSSAHDFVYCSTALGLGLLVALLPQYAGSLVSFGHSTRFGGSARQHAAPNAEHRRRAGRRSAQQGREADRAALSAP